MGSAAVAWAESDNRPQDRFYFGLHAGIANHGQSITDTPDVTSATSAFGLETTFWPNDYIGFGWGYDVAALPGATTAGLGAYAVVGIPLRYVQPYVGAWLGLRYLQMGDQGKVDELVHPVAGVNGYISRNTRLFVHVAGVRLDADSDQTAELVTAGVRWSPDAFHRLRGAGKFNALWLTSLTTVAAFVLTRRAVGGTWL